MMGEIIIKKIQIAFIIIIIVMFCSCQNNALNSSKSPIVGTWQLTNNINATVTFKSNSTIDLDISNIIQGIDIDISKLKKLSKLKYEVIDDNTLKVKASAFKGIINKEETLDYQITDEDKLIFLGMEYKRIN